MLGFCDSVKFRQGLHGVCPGWGQCFKQLNSWHPKRQLETKQHAHVFTEKLCVLSMSFIQRKQVGLGGRYRSTLQVLWPALLSTFPWWRNQGFLGQALHTLKSQQRKRARRNGSIFSVQAKVELQQIEGTKHSWEVRKSKGSAALSILLHKKSAVISLETSATPNSVNLGQSIWSSTEEGLLICEELWEEKGEGSMLDNTFKSAWTPPYLSQYFQRPCMGRGRCSQTRSTCLRPKVRFEVVWMCTRAWFSGEKEVMGIIPRLRLQNGPS